MDEDMAIFYGDKVQCPHHSANHTY